MTAEQLEQRFKDWARFWPTVVLSRSADEEWALANHDRRFLLWVDKNPDLPTTEDRDQIRAEFYRRNAAAEADRAKATATEDALHALGYERHTFEQWLAQQLTPVQVDVLTAIATWKAECAAKEQAAEQEAQQKRRHRERIIQIKDEIHWQRDHSHSVELDQLFGADDAPTSEEITEAEASLARDDAREAREQQEARDNGFDSHHEYMAATPQEQQSRKDQMWIAAKQKQMEDRIAALRTQVLDPVWLRGDDADALRALAAFRSIHEDPTTRRPGGFRLAITHDGLRQQVESHEAWTGLLAEVREWQVEDGEAREHLANPLAVELRKAEGLPPVVLPDLIDVPGIVVAGADGIARWLVAHRGQYTLTVGRRAPAWRLNPDDGECVLIPGRWTVSEPAEWQQVVDRCKRWTVWTALAENADALEAAGKADAATKLRDTAYAVVAGANAPALLAAEDEHWTFDAYVPPTDDEEQQDAPRPKRGRRPQNKQEIQNERAYKVIHSVFRAERNDAPSQNMIVEAFRKAGGSGGDPKVVKAGYHAYVEEHGDD